MFVSVCVRDRCFRICFILLFCWLFIFEFLASEIHTETKRRRNEHFASFDRRLYWQWRWLCRRRDCVAVAVAAATAAAHTHTVAHILIWVTWASFCFVFRLAVFHFAFFLPIVLLHFLGRFHTHIHTHKHWYLFFLQPASPTLPAVGPVARRVVVASATLLFSSLSLFLLLWILLAAVILFWLLLLLFLLCMGVVADFFWGRKLSSTH